MAFNRDNRNSGSRDRGGFRPRPSFGDRPRFSDRNDRGNDRGPVEMHSAVCDNCGKSCEVPFRPTSGKPVYCSNCFESKRENSDSGSSRNSGYERRSPERSDNGLAEINAKLDNILKLLESQKPVVKEKKSAKIKEIETIEAEEPTPVINTEE